MSFCFLCIRCLVQQGILFDGAIIPISRCQRVPIRVKCLLRDTGKMRTYSWNQTQTSSCSYTSPSTKARLPGHMPWQSHPLLCSNPRHMLASGLQTTTYLSAADLESTCDCQPSTCSGQLRHVTHEDVMRLLPFFCSGETQLMGHQEHRQQGACAAEGQALHKQAIARLL